MKRIGWWRGRLIALVLAVTVPAAMFADARLVGDLPRIGNRPLTALPRVETEYGEIDTAEGTRLRSIVTKPAGKAGRLPAILFVHWLSCDSVDFPVNASDGWSVMLTRLIEESGWLVQRIDKSGIGDSTGTPCAKLDYRTELAQHRAALGALFSRPDVDPKRVVVFGASMGYVRSPAGRRAPGRRGDRLGRRRNDLVRANPALRASRPRARRDEPRPIDAGDVRARRVPRAVPHSRRVARGDCAHRSGARSRVVAPRGERP